MESWQKGPEGTMGEASIVDQLQDSSKKPRMMYFGNRRCPFAHRAWWTALGAHENTLNYGH